MDGENNGNPIKMDDLGIPLFLETSIYMSYKQFFIRFMTRFFFAVGLM